MSMTTSIRRLSAEEALAHLRNRELSHTATYHAMYSSWHGGIITDPVLMMVPVDDHIVHRGDGIFEAIKCVDGRIYALEPHLKRLARSADIVHMPLPVSPAEMTEIIRETIRAADVDDCLIRLYVSRGPGGFTANPYECVGSQLYVVITALRPPGEKIYETGVTLKTSRIPVKEGYFANVKSCNYLHNVLMKKEAVDAGVDFTVSLDESGFLGEGSTENFLLLNAENELLVPRFERILRGVTVLRLMELARTLVEQGEIKRMSEADLRPEDAYRAREAFMTGTTIDILPVIHYDGHEIGGGVPGPIFRQLLSLIRKDLKSGKGILTSVR